MKRIIKISLALMFGLAGFAVQAQKAEMADTLRSEGKIYAVVGIILVILTGLIVYLVLLDRKVGKLEKRISEKK